MITRLTYAGSLPFILCAMCLVLDLRVLPVLGDPAQVMAVYGAVIASFMAGVHWGQHFAITDDWQIRLPILSNGIALAVWLALLILPLTGVYVVYIAAFAVLLWIDHRLRALGHIAQGYYKTRIGVSILVIAALLVGAVYV